MSISMKDCCVMGTLASMQISISGVKIKEGGEVKVGILDRNQFIKAER